MRNVIGLLLMTLGLTESCMFAPPAEWIAAIERRRQMEAREQELRNEWRLRATRAAEFLRSKYGLKRVAITGDLLSPAPLGYWSRLTLAVWDVPADAWLKIYDDLSKDGIEVEEAERDYFQEKLEKGSATVEEI